MPAKIPDTATCLTCGYALRSLPINVCPECGRTFDPADPRTYKPGPKSPWWHAFAGPPPGYFRWPLVIYTVFLLFDSSSPGLPTQLFPLFIVSMALTVCGAPLYVLVLLLDYGLRIAVRTGYGRHFDELSQQPEKSPKKWAVAPLCLAVLLSIGVFDFPLRIRFALSRPALERAAEAYLDGTRTNTGGQWIGLFRVEKISVNKSIPGPPHVFFETGFTLIDEIGFLYAPNRKGNALTPDVLPDPWYIYET